MTTSSFYSPVNDATPVDVATIKMSDPNGDLQEFVFELVAGDLNFDGEVLCRFVPESSAEDTLLPFLPMFQNDAVKVVVNESGGVDIISGGVVAMILSPTNANNLRSLIMPSTPTSA